MHPKLCAKMYSLPFMLPLRSGLLKGLCDAAHGLAKILPIASVCLVAACTTELPEKQAYSKAVQSQEYYYGKKPTFSEENLPEIVCSKLESANANSLGGSPGSFVNLRPDTFEVLESQISGENKWEPLNLEEKADAYFTLSLTNARYGRNGMLYDEWRRDIALTNDMLQRSEFISSVVGGEQDLSFVEYEKYKFPGTKYVIYSVRTRGKNGFLYTIRATYDGLALSRFVGVRSDPPLFTLLSSQYLVVGMAVRTGLNPNHGELRVLVFDSSILPHAEPYEFRIGPRAPPLIGAGPWRPDPICRFDLTMIRQSDVSELVALEPA